MKPKISLVTPSYNQGQFLEQTIVSVLDQNYPNLEYIVVDGGSTDDSVEIIKKYEDRLSYWVSEPDKGQTDAINKGLRRSSGEILNWINSDDYLLPGALNAAAEAFGNGDDRLGYVYGICRNITADGRTFDERKYVNYDSRILRFGRNLFAQPASLFHRRVLDKVGLLDEELNYAMDYEFWLRVQDAGFTFKNLCVPIAAFRFHGESKTIAGRSKQTDEYEQVMLDRVLHLNRNRRNLGILRSIVLTYRLKNVLIRGVQQGQWCFGSITRARKRGELD